MDGYDSDSSGDGTPYKETSVLLGYPSKDPTDDSISHLGGAPVRISLAVYNQTRLTVIDLVGWKDCSVGILCQMQNLQ